MNRKTKHTKRRWPWQTAQDSGLSSSQMSTDNPVTGSLPNQQDSQLPGTYHQTCNTLILSHFFEIMITGDLTWLIIKGNVLPSQLEEAWESIIEEYTSLIKTDKTDNIFLLYKKIKQTEFLMQFIEKTIDALKIQYDEEVASWLSERGFGVVEYSEDREIYLKSLNAIRTGAKMLVVMLNQYNAEYKNLNKDKVEVSVQQSESEKRFSYEKELSLLSRYQGQRINKQTITVMEYAAIINNFIEYHKAKKPVKENG